MNGRVICKVTLSARLFSLPIPCFIDIRKSKEILLHLSMKCGNSAFHAQGSRLITVVVHVGEAKIYVTPVGAVRKKERQDETQFTTKIGGKKLVWVPVISFCEIFIPN
jgi:hypothetical protein